MADFCRTRYAKSALCKSENPLTSIQANARGGECIDDNGIEKEKNAS